MLAYLVAQVGDDLGGGRNTNVGLDQRGLDVLPRVFIWRLAQSLGQSTADELATLGEALAQRGPNYGLGRSLDLLDLFGWGFDDRLGLGLRASDLF